VLQKAPLIQFPTANLLTCDSEKSYFKSVLSCSKYTRSAWHLKYHTCDLHHLSQVGVHVRWFAIAKNYLLVDVT